MTKYIAPILVLTASALYLRWCIKDANRPPTDVARTMVYHNTETDEDWEIDDCIWDDHERLDALGLGPEYYR